MVIDKVKPDGAVLICRLRVDEPVQPLQGQDGI
jgi:hypothetical protein